MECSVHPGVIVVTLYPTVSPAAEQTEGECDATPSRPRIETMHDFARSTLQSPMNPRDQRQEALDLRSKAR